MRLPAYSTTILLPTAPGRNNPITAFAGSRQSKRSIRIGVRMLMAASGSILIAVGIGNRIIRGVGPLFIMGVGPKSLARVGFGCPTISGPQPGWLGGQILPTSVGRRC